MKEYISTASASKQKRKKERKTHLLQEKTQTHTEIRDYRLVTFKKTDRPIKTDRGDKKKEFASLLLVTLQ
jgi:hypothetical protein